MILSIQFILTRFEPAPLLVAGSTLTYSSEDMAWVKWSPTVLVAEWIKAIISTMKDAFPNPDLPFLQRFSTTEKESVTDFLWLGDRVLCHKNLFTSFSRTESWSTFLSGQSTFWRRNHIICCLMKKKYIEQYSYWSVMLKFILVQNLHRISQTSRDPYAMFYGKPSPLKF